MQEKSYNSKQYSLKVNEECLQDCIKKNTNKVVDSLCIPQQLEYQHGEDLKYSPEDQS